MRALTFVLALGVVAAIGGFSTPADGGTSRGATATPAPCAVRQGTPRPTAASLSFVRYPSVLLASVDGKRLSTVLHGSGPVGGPGRGYDNPAWSPDGRCLAVEESYNTPELMGPDVWVSVRRGKSTIATLQTTADVGYPGYPSWAPDGRRVVLVNYEVDDDMGAPLGGPLYLEGVGSKKESKLTARFADDTPAWSPDGSRIAFSRRQKGMARLYLIRPDGKGLHQLTTNAARDPSWSPDGKRLAFETNQGIAVINANGSGLRYLTRSQGDQQPAWSPDGRTIAFVRDPSAKAAITGDIWLMSPDGSNQRLFVKNGSQPAWKPTS